MNAQTVLSLATLTLLLVGSRSLQAAEASTATLPDNEAQAAARAALDEAKSAPAAAPQQSATQSAPSATPPPAATQSGVISLAGPQPDNEAQAEARAALRQDDGYYSSPMATGTMPAKTGATSQPRSWTAGMEAPKLPITDAQQQQLDQLLQQYRANQISSSEYHTKRAEIIANK